MPVQVRPLDGQSAADELRGVALDVLLEDVNQALDGSLLHLRPALDPIVALIEDVLYADGDVQHTLLRPSVDHVQPVRVSDPLSEERLLEVHIERIRSLRRGGASVVLRAAGVLIFALCIRLRRRLALRLGLRRSGNLLGRQRLRCGRWDEVLQLPNPRARLIEEVLQERELPIALGDDLTSLVQLLRHPTATSAAGLLGLLIDVLRGSRCFCLSSLRLPALLRLLYNLRLTLRVRREGVDLRGLGPRLRQTHPHRGVVEVGQELARRVVAPGLHPDDVLHLRGHHVDLRLAPTGANHLVLVGHALAPRLLDHIVELHLQVVNSLVELLLGLVLLAHVRVLLAEGVEALHELVHEVLLVVRPLQQVHEAPLDAVQARGEVRQLRPVPLEQLAGVHQIFLL
mmetsp:Transcript_31889/g.91016  ORF Transcript_31889/g.91016 Transcript_31889/m.91016 type:complete len:400 (-) Transcript_31889:900-2099(-)